MHPPASNLRRDVSECSGGGRCSEAHAPDGLFNNPLGIDDGLLFIVRGVTLV